MANKPRGYGLTAEVNRKLAAKYDTEKEQEARQWMEAVLQESIHPEDGPLGPDKLHEVLKDGVFLCNATMDDQASSVVHILVSVQEHSPLDRKRLANIVTGSNIKINTSKMAFKQMENISKFLEAAEKFEVLKSDLFQTVDLYEKSNMWQVVCTIHAFGRKAQAKGANVPALGPKESEANKRTFTDEQMKAGQNVIGLQMGTNQGASQKGMSFGNTRHIVD